MRPISARQKKISGGLNQAADMSRDHLEVSDKNGAMLSKNIGNQLFGLVTKYRDYPIL